MYVNVLERLGYFLLSVKLTIHTSRKQRKRFVKECKASPSTHGELAL